MNGEESESAAEERRDLSGSGLGVKKLAKQLYGSYAVKRFGPLRYSIPGDILSQAGMISEIRLWGDGRLVSMVEIQGDKADLVWQIHPLSAVFVTRKATRSVYSLTPATTESTCYKSDGPPEKVAGKLSESSGV